MGKELFPIVSSYIDSQSITKVYNIYFLINIRFLLHINIILLQKNIKVDIIIKIYSNYICLEFRIYFSESFIIFCVLLDYTFNLSTFITIRMIKNYGSGMIQLPRYNRL